MTNKRRLVPFLVAVITASLLIVYWLYYRYPSGYIHGVGIRHQGETLFIPRWQMHCDETGARCQIPVGDKEAYFQLSPAYFVEDRSSQISADHTGCQTAQYDGNQIECNIRFFSSHPVNWGPYVSLEMRSDELHVSSYQRFHMEIETFLAHFSMGDEAIWKPILFLLTILSGVFFIFFLTYLMDTNSWVRPVFAAMMGIIFGAISLPVLYILLLNFDIMMD